MKKCDRGRKMRQIVFVFIVMTLGLVEGISEGEACTKLDKEGICVNIKKCTSALEELKNKIFPKICSFDEIDPIVCCFDKTNVTKTKYEDVRPIFIGVENDAGVKERIAYKPNDTCRIVPRHLTRNKTGQISWDKCIEYQHKLIFPCVYSNTTNNVYRYMKCAKLKERPSLVIGGNGEDTYLFEYAHMVKCIEYQHKLIFPCEYNNTTNKMDRYIKCEKLKEKPSKLAGGNGEDTYLFEYAHMALLGYGEYLNETQWLCGGTIISEKFILTAAHCFYTPVWGYVKRVAVGMLKRSDVPQSAQIFDVKHITNHPDYKPPSKYNDIALLELKQEIKLSEFLVPACLHTSAHKKYNTNVAIATGWGALSYKGPKPDVMQKMTLKQFHKDACFKQFGLHRLLKKGFDDVTQLCYGDPFEITDTCDGDSGGPLQIVHPHMYCMHLVTGVTSFGNHCGVVNQPSVYTRVESYVPWIESIVWPGN